MLYSLKKGGLLTAVLLLLAFQYAYPQLDDRFGVVGVEGTLHLGNSGVKWYRDWQNSYSPENYPPPGKQKIWTVGKIDYRNDSLGMDYKWIILDLLENNDANFLQSFLNLSLAIVEKIFFPMLNGYWQNNISALEDSLENVLDEQIVTDMVARIKYRAKFRNTKIDFQDELPDFQISVTDSIIQIATTVSIDWLTHIYVQAWVLNPNPFHWGYIWKNMGDADGSFHTDVNILGKIGLHGAGRNRRLQVDTILVDAKTESEIDWKALGIGFTWETLSNSVENLIDEEIESSLADQMNSDSLAQPYYLSDFFKSLFPNNYVPLQQEILDRIFEFEKPYIRSVMRPGDFTGQYWSIGYEPNFFPYMSPKKYAQYFTKYYRYIKSLDPDAKILGPSVLLTELMENPEQIVFSYIPPMLWGFIAGVEEEFADLIKSYFEKTNSQNWYQRFLENLESDVKIDVIDLHVFPLATRFQDIEWDSVISAIDSFAHFARPISQNREVWITEFGNIDYRRSQDEAVVICQNLCDYFKSNSAGITKWFWYLSLGHSPFYDTEFSPDPPISALLNSNLTLTKIGQAYLLKADNTPPIMPTAPQDGGVSVTADKLIFTWDPAVEQDTGIESYQLQVKEKGDDVIAVDRWVGNRLSARIYGFIGKTVIARVRAKNGAGLVGAWSPWSDGVRVLPAKKYPSDASKIASRGINDNETGEGSGKDSLFAATNMQNKQLSSQNTGSSALVILKNFPNPFNSNTAIQYQLGKQADVKIAVYNSLGQLIKELLAQQQTEGIHTVNWNGTDAFGNPAVSGIYFCQISADEFIQVRKILLLR